MANIPQEIQDRLDRTPAERKAELEARRQARLDAMTPEQRQRVQQQIDRINAVELDMRTSPETRLGIPSFGKTVR